MIIALSDFDEGTLILNDLLKERRKRSRKKSSTAKLMNRLVAINYTRGNINGQRYRNENNTNSRRDPW